MERSQIAYEEQKILANESARSIELHQDIDRIISHFKEMQQN